MKKIKRAKNVSETSKKILKFLIVGGTIALATFSSSFFIPLILSEPQRRQKYNEKKFKRKIAYTFYNLRRQGLIQYKKAGKQLYISLTQKGKERRGSE